MFYFAEKQNTECYILFLVRLWLLCFSSAVFTVFMKCYLNLTSWFSTKEIKIKGGTDKETERARGKDKQTETKIEKMGRGEWICRLCHFQGKFTLSVNDWFGASASTLVSYLINSGCNPFLQRLGKYKYKQFNQSKITGNIPHWRWRSV